MGGLQGKRKQVTIHYDDDDGADDDDDGDDDGDIPGLQCGFFFLRRLG